MRRSAAGQLGEVGIAGRPAVPPRGRALRWAGLASALLAACTSSASHDEQGAGAASSGAPHAAPSASSSKTAPAAMQPAPDGAPGTPAADAGAEPESAPEAGAPPAGTGITCPPDMVRVARRFCVDRYEAMLVDAETGAALSPFYPPSRRLAVAAKKFWEKQRLAVGDDAAKQIPLPPLPAWQKTRDFEPRAVARRGVIPQGHTSGRLAELACKNAGKRLCTLDEWRTACRGEANQPFPYGDRYVAGRCNVFREAHPAMILHGNPSVGHGDPRLNLVRHEGRELLRRTGETRSCASVWEGDAIYDMVGNLDEWVDDPEGTFVGGFYARSKKDGCASTVATHPFDYHDYSTGIRCCSDGIPP